ncbi:MAG TPA: hypothetical protein VFP23_10565 [Solirubrobacterales bacterium]|nr:hypothetical protein [Solirubrobacterales bacterium]
MRGIAKLASTAVAILLLALSIAACGASGGESTPPSTSPPAPAKSSEQGRAEVKPHPEAGEKSVEGFGSEAGGSVREAILGAERAYFGALADKDFGKACTHLSSSVLRSLEQLAPPQLRAEGCAGILPKLLAPTAPALARQQAAGDVRRVRIGGQQAFVIFHAPGARLWVLTMLREGGRWKATTIAGSILAPSAATLGTG